VDREWSPRTALRSVHYARLAGGSYRFAVQAVGLEGTVSPAPALVAFTILRPVWQRWWFLALAGVLAGLLLAAAYRYRVNRLLEFERIRTRIAADLHDDIGANLSLIAGVSEVLGAEDRRSDPALRERLSLIADVAQASVDAMGDIVWAINPAKDRLGDLTQRMRRFASDTLAPRNIALRISTHDLRGDAKLDPEARRETFLVFKQSLNNIVRHAGCGSVEVDLGIRRGMLELSVADDGRGFDPSAEHDGHGLESMRRRAEKLGGELQVASAPGRGCRISLRFPLDRRRRTV